MRITTTKRILSSGTSLAINITKELRALGLDRGDWVKVVLIKEDEEDGEDGD